MHAHNIQSRLFAAYDLDAELFVAHLLTLERNASMLGDDVACQGVVLVALGNVCENKLLEAFTFDLLRNELTGLDSTHLIFDTDTVLDLLYDDPYLLMDEGLDAPFGAVDRFAIELGVAGDDPRRVEAGILFELRYNLSAGHAFLPEEKLIPATCQLLSVEAESVQQGLARLLEADRLVRQQLAGITVIYLPDLYEAETACTEILLDFAGHSFPEPSGLNRMIRSLAKESGIAYSSEQEQAIRASATSGLLLITGGPGTGKTTTLNGILTLLEQMEIVNSYIKMLKVMKRQFLLLTSTPVQEKVEAFPDREVSL